MACEHIANKWACMEMEMRLTPRKEIPTSGLKLAFSVLTEKPQRRYFTRLNVIVLFQ